MTSRYPSRGSYTPNLEMATMGKSQRLGNSYCSSACQQQKTRESERDKERERDREREKERDTNKVHRVDMGPASARSAATATYVARCCQQQQRAGLMNIRVSYNTYTTETTITCRVATRKLWQGCNSPLEAGLRLASCGRVATRHLWQGCDSPHMLHKHDHIDCVRSMLPVNR